MVRCSQRCTERGTSHRIASLAPCGQEARDGPAPRLPVDGGHAPCRVRHLVRGSVRGARLLRRTEHGTSHRLATDARCGREARGGPAPRLPAGGGQARCRVRDLVRGCVRGARLQRRTEHGTSHGIATDAPCGREARGGPAPRLPSIAATHRAGSAAWCEVARVVCACSAARNAEPRTSSRRSHRAVSAVRRPVRGCARGARLQRRTGRGTSHGIETDAPCGREARGGPAPRLPAVRRHVHGVTRAVQDHPPDLLRLLTPLGPHSSGDRALPSGGRGGGSNPPGGTGHTRASRRLRCALSAAHDVACGDLPPLGLLVE